MYEETTKPLRNLARSEPLMERSRQMFTVPPEIPAAKVNRLPRNCRNFLTQPAVPAPPAPAPATLYTPAGTRYVLNGRASDLTVRQKNEILRCLKAPNGIRMLRVALIDNTDNSAELDVHFFNTNFLKEIVARYDADNSAAKMIFPISGGSRLRAGEAAGQVQVDSSNAPAQVAVSMPNEDKPVLRLVVKPIGDYSTYTLAVSPAATVSAVFDPLFAEINFKFRPGCFNAECAPDSETAPPPLPEPAIDYLAKDYESFRLTMIGAMSERVPGWQATSEADLDVTLLELFSAAADELSDYQDRVMNEAYLATARKRVSLARHARLMDYHIHQGNQASARLALEIEHDAILPKQFELREGLMVWAGESEIKGAKKNPVEAAAVFTLRDDERQTVHQLLNNIGLYTWSDSIPALKAGSTTADLKLYDRFYTGDSATVEATDEASAKAVQDLIRNYGSDKDNGKIKYLLIQEHLNPTTGSAAARDPSKRQLLKLLPGKAGAKAIFDPVTGEWLVRVNWEKTDALRRDYCFTIDCRRDNPDTAAGKIENISLFHGNLIEVFHGRPQITVFKEASEPLTIDPHKPLEFYYERTRRSGGEKDRWGTICRLPEKFLAYRKTKSGGDAPPVSTLRLTVADEDGDVDVWNETASLIYSDNGDESGDHFIVETDENRQSLIRFGNGINGRELSERSTVFCYYQYGAPLEGNVGADSIVNFDIDSVISAPTGLRVRSCRNPFDVADGKDIEPATEIIRSVPEAYRSRQLRAVTLADYVERAEEIEGVSRAAASYGWTGSWRTVRVTIDPFGTNELSGELRRKVADTLDAVRLIGEDIEIRPPKFVPLEIEVKLCAEPDVWIEDIRFVLEQEFSTGWTPDGRKGFFHPDSWTFGQALYASQIIERVMRVKGVEHVIGVSIKRRNSPFPASDSFTKINHNEIIEVLSDPNFAERGFIDFEIKGGRQ
jgi:hypothetical protein